MRIQRLRISAFGPFAEPVDLDFAALNDAGLFLLTGSNGAGKSSILDAVCFALYGAVPGERNAARRFRSDHAGPGEAPMVELEAGFSADPRFELAQKMDALLRDCRALVALGLHCQRMSMREAVEVFMQVGHQSELPATREAMRGAWDPLYLTYTLGKLLIHELRHEQERRPGYTLRSFHDAFLDCGNLPIRLMRDLLG